METVRDGLARYHRDNGFRGDSMTEETIQVRFMGESVDMPNPKFQRHLLARHDLHHVLTGYDTSWVGEAEMGAWELAAGSWHWFVWANNLGAVLMGVVAPIRTLRALVRGLLCRSLYRERFEYDALLDTPIDDVRARLRIPAGGYRPRATIEQ